MSNVKWIKLSANVFDNRKIRMIEHMPDGDSIIVIWLKLLCLAGQVNDGGMVYFTEEIPYTDEMMSSQFDRPLNTVRMALQTFERFGMIDLVDDIIHISNWEKYQSLDKMEHLKEQHRIAQQKYREKQKMLPSDITVTSHVTSCDALDIDIEEDKDKDLDINSKRKRFVAPTVEQVTEYCRERNSSVNPETFVSYYAKQGWYLANGRKMVDWKAAVRNWETREKPKTKTNPSFKNDWMKGYTKK